MNREQRNAQYIANLITEANYHRNLLRKLRVAALDLCDTIKQLKLQHPELYKDIETVEVACIDPRASMKQVVKWKEEL